MSLPLAGTTSLWIGWRYLATRGRAFVSFITWVSVSVLVLGVGVLVVVISVMSGLDAELHRRILSTMPHVVLVPPVGDIDDAALERFGSIGEPYRFFESEGMAARGTGVEPVAI